MTEQHEGVYELWESKFKRLSNGNQLRLVFEKTDNKEERKELIDFEDAYVQATITREDKPDINISDEFTVFQVLKRPLKDGSKLRIILSADFDIGLRRKSIDMENANCKVFLEKVDRELDLSGDDEEVEDE